MSLFSEVFQRSPRSAKLAKMPLMRRRYTLSSQNFYRWSSKPVILDRCKKKGFWRDERYRTTGTEPWQLSQAKALTTTPGPRCHFQAKLSFLDRCSKCAGSDSKGRWILFKGGGCFSEAVPWKSPPDPANLREDRRRELLRRWRRSWRRSGSKRGKME